MVGRGENARIECELIEFRESGHWGGVTMLMVVVVVCEVEMQRLEWLVVSTRNAMKS